MDHFLNYKLELIDQNLCVRRDWVSLLKRPVAGFVLSLISSIFIVLNAAWLSLGYTFAIFYFTLHQSHYMLVGTRFLPYLTIFGAICGLIVLIGPTPLQRREHFRRHTRHHILHPQPTHGRRLHCRLLVGVVGGALALSAYSIKIGRRTNLE
ncbi:MAG: hypothetical protein AOA65_0208 [Candidatus Bathyarchaeota archaeon BA1]|nr:MAG: hypothetical protein AOA65_0208 [Candidatus Bathyarchaeota archaeon BA1]